MRTRGVTHGIFLASLIWAAAFQTHKAQAQANSWTNGTGGFWHTPGNWSLGTPPDNTQSGTFITNGIANQTVTLNSSTPVGNLTISNLNLSSPPGTTNTLSVSNLVAPLQIINFGTFNPGSIVNIANSTLLVEGTNSSSMFVNGAFNILGGAAVTNANNCLIGQSAGTLTIDSGTMTINGGTFNSEGVLTVGNNFKGALWLLNGGLITTNNMFVGSLVAGEFDRGQVTISNGTWRARAVYASFFSGGNGTITFAGGTSTMDTLGFGFGSGAKNATVWVTGNSTVLGTNVTISMDSALAQMTISNGLVQASGVAVGGSQISAYGTLTIVGGSLKASGRLGVGVLGGTVWITGGELVVSNNGTSTSITGINSSQIVISNGFARLGALTVGQIGQSAGVTNSLIVAGGTNTYNGNITIFATNPLAVASVQVGGGLLDAVTTNLIDIASVTSSSNLVGDLTVSGGIMRGGTLHVAGVPFAPFARGTLTVSGGTAAFVGPLNVGASAGSTGTVWVTGGLLVITNTPGTVSTGSGFAVDGTVTLTNGSSIVVSNADTIVGNVGSGVLTNLGGSVLVSNLVVGNNSGSAGTVWLSNGTVTSQGTVTLGSGAGSIGTVLVNGGELDVTNGIYQIGGAGNGRMIISNGTVRANILRIASGNSGVGTLTVVNGTNFVNGGFTVGSGSSSTGSVLVAGTNGLLVVTNATPTFGSAAGASASLTVSNGTVLIADVSFGSAGGGCGTLTMAGGNLGVSGAATVLGDAANSTGAVWLTGGTLGWTNGTVTIGNNGSGQLTISNSVGLSWTNLMIGALGNARGTFTAAAGTCVLPTQMILGNYSCGAIGVINVAGGTVLMTNATANIDVRSGTITVSAGSLLLQRLDVTNACGRFLKTGGTVSITTTNLSPNLSAVGDQIPNSWKLQYHLDPFDPNLANEDADGDGYSNLQEYLAGTDPTSAASFPNSTSWILPATGNWEITNDWSLGRPTITNMGVFVTNITTKIVGIGPTATNFPASLSVSNLVVAGPTGTINIVRLFDLGSNSPVRIVSGLTINSGGAVEVNNTVRSSTLRIEGALTINAGVSNASLSILTTGTVSVAGPVTIGSSAGTTGLVFVTAAGQLVVTNNPVLVGAGTGFIVDGSVTLTNGSSVIVSNSDTTVGNAGNGVLTNAGGSMITTNVFVARLGGSIGTLALNAGTTTVRGTMIVGGFGCASTGIVNVAGGSLFITNGSHSAVLDVRSGSVLLNSGTLVIDQLVVTNACGRFVHTGGALTITTTNLSPGLSAVGDQIPNSWKLQYHLDPFDPNLASEDSDGDGFNNLQEFLAGTDPTNATSAATVTSWNTSSSSKWETDVNWSAGAPNGVFQRIFITNAIIKTVTVDATTTNTASTMTVSNLIVSAPSGNHTNTLSLANVGLTPLRVLNSLTISVGGVLQVTNSTLRIDGLNGGELVIDGGVGTLTSGSIMATNTSIVVGHAGAPSMLNLNGGTAQAASVLVGRVSSSQGTLTLNGVALTAGNLVITNRLSRFLFNTGTVTVTNTTTESNLQTFFVGNSGSGLAVLNLPSGLHLFGDDFTVGGFSSMTTGQVWMSGGQLVVTNLLKTLTIDFGQMSISNGTVLAVLEAIGQHQGTLTLAGGTNVVTGTMNVGAQTGTVWVTDGQLLATNIIVGSGNRGQLTVSNGTLRVGQLTLANVAASQGIVTMAGGTNLVQSGLTVGSVATGAVWITGGQLDVANNTIIGDIGIGQMVMSNGIVRPQNLFVGFSSGGQGTLTINGGTIAPSGSLVIANNSSTTGSVFVAGGQLFVTNSLTKIGNLGVGQMTVSNATVSCLDVTVGAVAGGRGTLTMAAGSDSIYGSLVLGVYGCTATGNVVVAGGLLLVTNATVTAVLDVRSGTVLVSGGVLQVDKLVVTNSCGHVVRTGGTLLYNQLVLDPNLSAVGDGIPNGWKQQYGLDPFDPNLANEDPDGDGMSNLQEFLADSNPVADIKAIASQGNDIRITWQAAAAKTNALQSSTGSNGSYSNNFADIFVVTNNIGAVTNYLDVGGATNFPARYYRVRLVP
jgi:Bacterial TSP3 repeat